MIGATKLNEKQVAEIKELFQTTNLTDTEIGAIFNVSRPHIWAIRNGKRWNSDIKTFYTKVELDMMLEAERPFILEEKKSKNIFQSIWQFIKSVVSL